MLRSARGPLRDLSFAQEAIDLMSVATEFNAFYKSWQDFLIRIERAWEATEREFRGAPGFQSWFRPYAQQKKSDPLLVYLHQARHAETHAISPTMDHPLRLVLRDRHGHPFRVRHIKSTLDQDGTLSIDVETAPEDSLLSLEVTHVPTRPNLVRFANRGVWYEPPTSHLGNHLPSIDPISVARLGAAFYCSFVKDAEHHFRQR